MTRLKELHHRWANLIIVRSTTTRRYKMRKHELVIVMTLASLFSVQTAHADGPAGAARGLKTAPVFSYISEKRRTTAPFAHVMFCARNPDECTARGDASEVSLGPLADEQLRIVNTSVNRSIRSLDDRPDQGDVWQVNVTAGDCEDFALTKRDHLIAMGWSTKALRIAVTKTPSGKGHAVLVVRTDQGDLVLDNRTNAIKGWKDTDLRWLMIQSGDNPRIWYEL
jgi:predicted transglutaminase-like cysteine proteinase